MGAGDKISYAKIKELAGSTSWRHSYSGSTKGTYTYYIHAPVWYFSLTIKGYLAWGYCEGSLYVDYYNPSLKEYQNIYGSFHSVDKGSESYTWLIQHNYKEQGTYLTGGTGLFRVRMYIGGDSGSCSWQAYTGGIEMLPESTYNSYFKGKKIIGCMCEMNTKEWSLENSPLRGTKISVQNNTHLLLGSA